MSNESNDSSDDEIPVLRDAVARRKPSKLSSEQIDDICDSINAEAWVLIDKLLAEALQEAEERIRIVINDRLSHELPALISKALQEKLGETDND